MAMVAGEASGDLLAGLLLDGMYLRWPSICAACRHRWHCRCSTRGFRRLVAERKAGGTGLCRGIAPLPRDHRYSCAALRSPFDCSGGRISFIGVDAPDFNLDLERALKLARRQDGAFCVPLGMGLARGAALNACAPVPTMSCACFPFEPALLQRARHRGNLCRSSAWLMHHPLAGPDKQARRPPRTVAVLGATTQVVAILPGSRRSEIQYIWRAGFSDAAAIPAQT